MPGLSNYNVCLSSRDDNFVPALETISHLIDYLDTKMLLDGPDRDDSRLVFLPPREVEEWKNYLRNDSTAPITPLYKRYVNLLYSNTIPEISYKHYGELQNHIDNSSRDRTLVASLGPVSRRFSELVYCPAAPDEERQWVQAIVVHVLRGYHALWDRMWDERSQQKVWRLQATKGFTLMFSYKLNTKVPLPTLPQYLKTLQQKGDFQEFVQRIGQIIGNSDFELIGEHTG